MNRVMLHSLLMMTAAVGRAVPEEPPPPEIDPGAQPKPHPGFADAWAQAELVGRSDMRTDADLRRLARAEVKRARREVKLRRLVEAGAIKGEE